MSKRLHALVLTCTAATVIGGLAVQSPAFATNYGPELYAGETLFPNDYIKQGSLKLIMQTDGNLVLYRGTRACAASRTTGIGTNKATMQHDGNFVVYNGTRAVWSTQTGGKPQYANGRIRLVSTSSHPNGEARVQSPDGRVPQNAKWFWHC